jgi:hypothetical protein
MPALRTRRVFLYTFYMNFFTFIFVIIVGVILAAAISSATAKIAGKEFYLFGRSATTSQSQSTEADPSQETQSEPKRLEPTQGTDENPTVIIVH